MSHENITLAELATSRPGASRVFMAHGLDFCCRGRRTLAEACAEKQIDPERILREIHDGEVGGEDITTWTSRPIGDLVTYIERRYHDRLRYELPELLLLARKVEQVHADKQTCPRGLAAHVESFGSTLVDHADKEEITVFPALREGRAASAANLMHALEREHEDLGRGLALTRALTANLEPPPEACTTWRALYLRLAALEADLMDHIHLENNVLFPRALCEG